MCFDERTILKIRSFNPAAVNRAENDILSLFTTKLVHYRACALNDERISLSD
jgi:hypothetical protein